MMIGKHDRRCSTRHVECLLFLPSSLIEVLRRTAYRQLKQKVNAAVKRNPLERKLLSFSFNWEPNTWLGWSRTFGIYT